MDKALNFLTLPRIVGTHPETKKDVIASVGPYGPYLKHDNKFLSLKEDDVTITSKGYLWTFPGKKIFKKSICVLPEKTNYKNLSSYTFSNYI